MTGKISLVPIFDYVRTTMEPRLRDAEDFDPSGAKDYGCGGAEICECQWVDDNREDALRIFPTNHWDPDREHLADFLDKIREEWRKIIKKIS